jgi:thermostable 8-oxoguanine DNA glycosylase
MQVMFANVAGAVRQLEFPEAHEYLLPGIVWGRFDELLTPAYWRGQAWQHAVLGTYSSLRLGSTLAEEVAACLLGGFGMRAEIGLRAYARLRERDLLSGRTSPEVLEGSLAEPFMSRSGPRRYRFPRQKARYLAGCLDQLAVFEEPSDDVQLRANLARLPGIGLKTASWIVRNRRESNAVAVIDVHILRAGRHLGLFAHADDPQRDYLRLEQRFLSFSRALDVSASMLDGLMWDYMRRLPPLQSHATSSCVSLS